MTNDTTTSTSLTNHSLSSASPTNQTLTSASLSNSTGSSASLSTLGFGVTWQEATFAWSTGLAWEAYSDSVDLTN